MEAKFSWKCSYMSTMEYQVIDETGCYRIETNRAPSQYQLSICNGDTVRRDTLAKVGLLVRVVGYGCDKSIPAATVAAFNAWRLSEHKRHMATLESQPEKYGCIAADDPLRAPPAACPGAHYVSGQGWTLDATANEYCEESAQ
jgi:hypothetical protein